MAIVAAAGETETGLVDDIDKLADLAQEYGTWLHADAAYGGAFVISERTRGLFNGISRADSITVDPHKQMLYTPYPCGATLFRCRLDHALVQNGARYLQAGGNKGLFGSDSDRNLGLATRIEGSMGGLGASMAWMTMKLLGEEGMRTILDHSLDMTEHAYDLVSQSEVLEPMFKPETSTLLVVPRREKIKDMPRAALDCLVNTSQRRLEEKGYYVSVNGDVNNGCCAFRLVMVNPYTDKPQVEEMLGLLDQIVQEELCYN
jgi:glutamate/tyrosine decarboxylase-like PLP-dependent enzyme